LVCTQLPPLVTAYPELQAIQSVDEAPIQVLHSAEHLEHVPSSLKNLKKFQLDKI